MVEKITIINTTLNKKCVMDMDTADYLLYEGGINWGNVGVTHNTLQYSRQVGKIISETVIGTRDVSISGWIIGDTIDEINKKKKLLSTISNPLDDIIIEAGDWQIKCKPSSNVTYSKTYPENNEVACKFLLQFFCPYPLFESTKTYGRKMTEDEGMFKFPLVLPSTGVIMSTRKLTASSKIINTGSVEVGCEINLRALSTVNNPKIFNVNTGESLQINKRMVTGEEIIITTTKGSRNIVGGIVGEPKTNYFSYLDFDSTWFQLPVGESNFTYKTYDIIGEEDTTYKNLIITISYKLSALNLEDE